MVEMARDILGATDLPCIMDGDDGYGDVKSVARMISAYAEIGVGAVVIEDQIREVKQSGNNNARGVAPLGLITAKLRAAVETRPGPDMMVIARCDAYAIEGLEASLRRCEAYLRSGADGVLFPASPPSQSWQGSGKPSPAPIRSSTWFEGRSTWLKPSELAELGFSQVVYPNFVMLRAMLASESALAQLHRFATAGAVPEALPDVDGARALFRQLVREKEWVSLEQRFQPVA